MANELKSDTSAKTGKKLKERRVEMGFSTDQMADKLFINKDYLTAIENGDYAIFPSESFAKAYFKKYINFLKIDTEFPSIFELKPEKRHKKIASEISFNDSKDTYIFYFLISFVLAISIVLIYFFSNNFLRDAELVEEDSLNTKNINLSENFVLEDPVNIKDIVFVEERGLTLEFFGECWIELYIDQELIEAQLFKKGDKYIKDLNPPFKIIIGNADFVKGTYNGQYIDFISNANRLTKVNIINFNE